jgi:hypothetical protein
MKKVVKSVMNDNNMKKGKTCNKHCNFGSDLFFFKNLFNNKNKTLKAFHFQFTT